MIRTMIRGAVALSLAFSASAALADGMKMEMKTERPAAPAEGVVIELGPVAIHDPYARASGRMAQMGGVFMGVENRSDRELHIVGARSDAARKTQLHTTIMQDGVMRMIHLEDGVRIAPGEIHWFKRGGDHIMLMGLRRPLENGDKVHVVLIFEKAGEHGFDVPVDNERGGPGMKMEGMEREGGMMKMKMPATE